MNYKTIPERKIEGNENPPVSQEMMSRSVDNIHLRPWITYIDMSYHVCSQFRDQGSGTESKKETKQAWRKNDRNQIIRGDLISLRK